jgi:hypothetical protein
MQPHFPAFSYCHGFVQVAPRFFEFTLRAVQFCAGKQGEK